jgi:hypothetical protein
MTSLAGCGCGQSQSSGRGCGCGPAAAGLIYDGGFTRPSFFDGQLLCADDLQALTAYVRGKDRLHNRYLTGSGVVCGLDVVCSCADRGTVIVRAGYALDCCGNDIVVPCDQTVDIDELVNLLPRDASCLDPCPPPTNDVKNDKEDGDGGSGSSGNGKNGGGGTGDAPTEGEGNSDAPTKSTSEKETKADKARPRRYELVLEYAETPADLIAPYSSGDATTRACEPSRVREGYRFRLRCASAKRVTPPSLHKALTCCKEVDERLKKLEDATKIATGLAAEEKEPLLALRSSEDMESVTQQLRESPSFPRLTVVASMAAQFAIAGDHEPAKQALQEVLTHFRLVRDSVRDDEIASAEADALYRAVLSLDERLPLEAPTKKDRLLAKGIISGDQVSGTLQSVVMEARDWALHWLEQQPGSHCRLVDSLGAIRIAVDDAETLLHAAEKVTSAIRQILLDCMCSAINPTCAPCEDEAVVLAHVTVDRCEVIDICNQVRRHAITGTALRYWLPVEWLYCGISLFCCRDADKLTQEGFGGLRELLRKLPPEPTDCAPPTEGVPDWYKSIRSSDKQNYGLSLRVGELDHELAGIRQQLAELSAQTATESPPPERSTANTGSAAKLSAAKQTAAKQTAAKQTRPTKKATTARKRTSARGTTHG